VRSELRLHLQGMDCADEAALIRHVLQVPGILDLNFDLVGRRVDVQFDASIISADTILGKVQGTGLGAHSHAPGEHVHDDHGVPSGASHGLTLRFIVASAVLMLAGWAVEAATADTWTEALLGHAHTDVTGGVPEAAAAGEDRWALAATGAYGLAMLSGLVPVLPRALAALRHQRLDMHVLVCVSAVGAAVVGQWAEGASVATLFGVAHLMEAWSIEHARVAVSRAVGHEPGWDGGAGEAVAGRVERYIERFASVYTPVVTGLAVVVAVGPPLMDGAWTVWFYRALIFLVLACPCALVISTPVTVVAAVTSAVGRGVLFRGGLALERAADDAAAAIARGDVVLTAQALREAEAFAGAHARRALGVIRQNVALAMLTKLAFLVSAVLGAAPLWLAVVADTGATVAVTLNGLRLLRAR